MKKQIIHNILTEFQSEEIEILGDNNVNKIVNGIMSNNDTKLFSSEKGNNLSFELIISSVATVVSIVDIVIKIYEAKKSNKKECNYESIKIELIHRIESTDTEIQIGDIKESIIKKTVKMLEQN